MCLEPFLEGGETVSVSDGGRELIPPLGGQTGEELVLGLDGLERWDQQTVVNPSSNLSGTYKSFLSENPNLPLDSGCLVSTYL